MPQRPAFQALRIGNRQCHGCRMLIAPSCRAAPAAAPRCCKQGKAPQPTYRRRPGDCCRLSAAGRRDPSTTSPYRRTGRRSQWPVHPSEQPADANCNYGSRIGLRLDGAT
jgi:hypothetical protein